MTAKERLRPAGTAAAFATDMKVVIGNPDQSMMYYNHIRVIRMLRVTPYRSRAVGFISGAWKNWCPYEACIEFDRAIES
jgi:hypothetical protein